MDPVGITKAWTRVVVPKSRSRMVMAHSAMVPRGGSALAAVAARSGSATAVLLGDFIRLTPSVYQQAAGENERPQTWRYRCSPRPNRSGRHGNRRYPKYFATKER